MKKILILIGLFLTALILPSQNFEITWQNCFGGTEHDKARDIIETDGGYLIVGVTMSNDGDVGFNHGGDDLWIIKIDTIGNMIWEKCLGGSKGDGGHRIFPTKDGNYYILAGSASSDGDISNDPYPSSPDYWIIKINPEGNIIWEKIVGSSKLNQLFSGITTHDGGVIAIGYSSTNDGDMSVWYGYYDMWMIKLNSEGEIEWDYTLGSSDFDFPYDIIRTTDGGYLISGSAIVEPGGNLVCNMHDKADAILVKLDSSRNIEWQRCYGGSDYDGAARLLEVTTGYIFIGYVRSFDGDINGNHGESDIWVVKVDQDGNIVWQKSLGGSLGEYPHAIFVNSQNEIEIWGTTESNDGNVQGNHSISEHYTDIWYIKIDAEGEFITQQCIGGEGSEEIAFGVLKKSHNNFIIAGRTDYASDDVNCDLHGYNDDFWVFEIKDCSLYAPQTPSQPTGPDTLCYTTDSTGIYSISPAAHAWGYEWKLEPETAGTITGGSLLATVNWNQQYEGQVSIQSRSYNDCGDSDWSPVKSTFVYNCVGLEEIETAGVNLKVYPNPATESVVFEISALPGSTKANPPLIIIRDVYGKIIEKIPVKGSRMIWEAEDALPGIYLYQLQVGGANISGKVMVY